MSRPRFLADNDLKEQILDGLLRREQSIEIVRARDVNLRRQPDAELLAFAQREQFIIISHDVNTMPAAAYERMASGQHIAGLLMVRQTTPIAPVIESLLLIWSSSDAHEWQHVVAFLPL